MMYTKTLIILVILLFIGLGFLMFGCNCSKELETFQNKVNNNKANNNKANNNKANNNKANNNKANKVYLKDVSANKYLAYFDKKVRVSEMPFELDLMNEEGIEPKTTFSDGDIVQIKIPNRELYLHSNLKNTITTWYTGSGNKWTINNKKIIGSNGTLLKNIDFDGNKYNFKIDFINNFTDKSKELKEPKLSNDNKKELKESKGVIPVELDYKYTINSYNLKKTNIPEVKNIEFTEFTTKGSKLDISGINTSNLTFSTLIKPTIPDNVERIDQENLKQVIASSPNWYIELKSNNVKLVYNGIIVESKIVVKFYNVYLISVVISNNYISIMINGNETIKEFDVPTLKTQTIKLGQSSRNNHPYYGLMANWDIVEGALTSEEICKRHNFCSAEAPACNFKPAGKTRMDCIKLCDLNENCSSINCQNACLNCKNPLNCEWLSLTDENTYIDGEVSVPSPPEIRAIAHGSGQIVLDWQAPKSNGSPIKNYAIVVNESFNKNNGITFRQLADTNCTSCEYIINGLKNRVYYDVSVAAVNDIGVSDFSNIESIAPVGPVRNTDISPLLIEDDAEIENSTRKIISDNLESQICERILTKSRDGHYLNKKRVRFADQVKDELLPKIIK